MEIEKVISIIESNIDREIKQWKIHLDNEDEDTDDDRYYIEKDGIKKELELLKYKMITDLRQQDRPIEQKKGMMDKMFRKKGVIIEREDLRGEFNKKDFEHLDVVSRLQTINDNQRKLGIQLVVYNILIIIMLLVTKLVIG